MTSAAVISRPTSSFAPFRQASAHFPQAAQSARSRSSLPSATLLARHTARQRPQAVHLRALKASCTSRLADSGL